MSRNHTAAFGRYELVERRFAAGLWLFDSIGQISRKITRRKSTALPTKPAKILIQTGKGIGDAVAASAAIAAMQRLHPEAQFDILASPAAQGIAEMIPGVSEIFVIDNPLDHLRNLRGGGFSEARRLFRKLQQNNYDLAVDFVSDLARNWALKNTRAKITIGHDSMGGGFWLTHPIKRDWSNVHQMDIFKEILQVLGWREELPPMQIEPSDNAINTARKLQEEHDLPAEGFIVCSPGASSPWKNWPANRFTEALNRFASDKQMPVVLTGSEAEGPLIKHIRQGLKVRSVDLSGIHLAELAVLIDNSKVFLGNDSGPAHLAAAFNKPRVVLFGPMPASRFAHPGPRSAILEGTDCRYMPCSYGSCKNQNDWCMDGIKVMTVVEALMRVKP